MSLDERIGSRSRARGGHQVDRDERDERFDVSAAETAARDDDDFLDDWQDLALPTLPKIPGYHVCYLSTTHQMDPITRRMQMGYTPVRPSEIPGFRAGYVASADASSLPGMSGEIIQVNEMIAFKIPDERYQRLMASRHHDKPILEEQGLNSSISAMPVYDIDPGTEETVYGKPQRAPDFIRAGF